MAKRRADESVRRLYQAQALEAQQAAQAAFIATHGPPPVDPRCAAIQTDIESVWSRAIRARILERGAFVSVSDMMDQVSSHWVQLRTALCNDSDEARERYEARMGCLDQWLLDMRARDKAVPALERALVALGPRGVRDTLDACLGAAPPLEVGHSGGISGATLPE